MQQKIVNIFPPGPLLRPFIRHYAILYPGAHAGGGVFLPYSGGILSFFNEAPVSLGDDQQRTIRTINPTLFGPVGKPFYYRRDEPKQRLDVSVVFTPLGTAYLCGPVVDELESSTAELVNFLSAQEISRISEQLYEAGSPEVMVSLLDAFFFKRLRRCGDTVPDSLVRALARLESPGATGRPADRYSVDELSGVLSLSARQLQRVMLRLTGLTPKRYLSVLRIRHLIEAMRLQPHLPYAHLAFEFGYVDQAHLTRDFRKHTLSSPTSFFASDAHEENRVFMDIE